MLNLPEELFYFKMCERFWTLSQIDAFLAQIVIVGLTAPIAGYVQNV